MDKRRHRDASAARHVPAQHGPSGLRRHAARALLCVGIAACGTWAGDGKAYFAVPPLDRSYVGPSVRPYAHDNQRYNLFLPRLPRPPGGYPVLLNLDLGGWVDSHRTTAISSVEDVTHAALAAGFAVVWASATVSRGLATRNPIDEPPGVGYGPAYPGNGVFIPPGMPPPPGYTGSVHPYYDPSRPMPEKDIVMLIQHVKAQAASGGLPIDPSKIVLQGRSAAAVTAWWVVAGPDRSDLWPDPKGQELQDTTVAAAVLRAGLTWWQAYSRKAPPLGFHFPRRERTGRGFYDHPSANLGAVPPVILPLASALGYGLDEAAAPGITLTNHTRSIYLAYGTAANARLHVSGPPWVTATETNPHSLWSGVAWKAQFCNTHLALFSEQGLGFEDLVDVTAPTFEVLVDDIVRWMQARVAGIPETAWTLLPGARAGSLGEPLLVGCGEVSPNAPGTIRLSLARPGAVTGLALVVAAGPGPFTGGRETAAPALLCVNPADASGGWELDAVWPIGLPPSVSLCFETYVADPAAARQVAASNGLAVQSP